MKTVYETTGTCSKAIILDVDDVTGIINSVQFIGGCPGNTVGVAQLVRGQKVNDVIGKLEGIHCGTKPTSCPDQLAHALRQALTSKA
ncbi:MAG: TIGR03905 family TSCPD domain-containing protein [Bacteroidaceae bacterium]|nr:TIGR03905 family TSCPD domain-containing protein [Bacteroidaceae bacterium]